MIRPHAHADLARLLRADVPTLDDEQFVVTLAELARSSTTVPIRRRVPLGVKVGAVVASVAVSMFGAAYASELLAPAPPTNSNPSSPGTDEPTERERETRGPHKPDGPVDDNPSPAIKTESPGSDGEPSDDDESTPEDSTDDATGPAGTQGDPSPEGPASEQPPSQSDPGPDDDDDFDPDSDPDDDSDSDDDSDDDSESDDSDNASGTDGGGSGDDDPESDDDSGAESPDEPDDSSDDDSYDD